MQRQAVPLMRPEAPVVGTGLEGRVALDSRSLIRAEGDGVIDYVDATKIVVKYNLTKDEQLINFDEELVQYNLVKFRRTNQDTCINLKPIVVLGQKVVEGQPLCEGYATQGGELALGRNLKERPAASKTAWMFNIT